MFPGDREVLVTAALPYVNGECHIGHLRTYVPADIFTRTLRKLGYKVLFVCGSDTHAAKDPALAHASLTSDPSPSGNRDALSFPPFTLMMERRIKEEDKSGGGSGE